MASALPAGPIRSCAVAAVTFLFFCRKFTVEFNEIVLRRTCVAARALSCMKQCVWEFYRSDNIHLDARSKLCTEAMIKCYRFSPVCLYSSTLFTETLSFYPHHTWGHFVSKTVIGSVEKCRDLCRWSQSVISFWEFIALKSECQLRDVETTNETELQDTDICQIPDFYTWRRNSLF